MAKSNKPKKPAAKTAVTTARLVVARPRITDPTANESVPAGVDLQVFVTTNRDDLAYKVVLTDTNPPPGPVTVDVPAPGTASFIAVFDGSNLQANRTYTVRVFVDPADGSTPPHLDQTINIDTNTPEDFVLVMSGPRA